jgi:hypothetical protein
MFIAFALVVALHGPVATDQHGHGNSAHTTSSTHAATPVQTHGNSSHGASTTTAAASHGNSSHGSSPKHTTPTTSTTGTTLTPVQQKVQSHTQLASKLQSRLPAGTDVVAAAKGFRNLGQFVAAVNVSHNLRIPFTALKADIVTRNMSLGQSIQDLRPSANATQEADRGETEAKKMIGSGAQK